MISIINELLEKLSSYNEQIRSSPTSMENIEEAKIIHKDIEEFQDKMEQRKDEFLKHINKSQTQAPKFIEKRFKGEF